MTTSTSPSPASQKKEYLQLSFDVGHSSIGWAVLTSAPSVDEPDLLGCGVVTFPKNGCLASERRVFRRQRRHIRSTRARIARMEQLLGHLGVLSEAQLAAKREPGGGHGAPWLLAARVLEGGPLLGWAELWDVLRWYAHNRGYDGNKAWSRQTDTPENKEDTEKEKNALELFTRYGTRSMAVVFCRICGLDPLGKKHSACVPPQQRPKGLNAAFPREDVMAEVQAILERHVGALPSLDKAFIRCLMEDWHALPCPAIALPLRYGQAVAGGRSAGGLLFGQLIPQFENRIIATCPIRYEEIYRTVLAESGDEAKARREAEKKAKVPTRKTPEFFRFRWAMQVANLKVVRESALGFLSMEERRALDAKMQAEGAMTKGEFKKAVKEVTGGAATNVEQVLTHPDADEALVLDPARHAIRRNKAWKAVFPHLSEAARKRVLGQLRRGRSISLAQALEHDGGRPGVEAALETIVAAGNTRRRHGQETLCRETLLRETIQAKLPGGRAPFSREVLKATVEAVFSGATHPNEEGGPLYRNAAIRAAHRERSLDHQTNNHLVRHRLLILDRLHRQLIRAYAGGEPGRVGRITIEVNRDLKELSGKTAKEIAKDLGQRLGNFKSVVAKLEKELAGTGVRITPGLIRKARIAEDLGWRCPYTGKQYDAMDLAQRTVDKDHIIPYADRQSDSLDSLVITFSSINRMKDRRTAMQFIRDCQAQPVPDQINLTIRTLADFQKAVDALDIRRGHLDDQRRKKRRKEWLLTEEYVEKGFTPRDLTQTSQLTRLGTQLLARPYDPAHLPVITPLPGIVTGTVRKAWHLAGCLARANPQVIDPQTGRAHSKTEIRGITQLHHALDACVLGLIAHYLPRDGSLWELVVRRGKLKPQEQARLKATPLGKLITLDSQERIAQWHLPESLKEKIGLRLAERRVVQHLPAELNGLKVEQNPWRIVRIEGGEAHLEQRTRQPDGTRPLKKQKEKLTRLLGATHPGKLQKNKAALVIAENFGLALDPEPKVIPYFKVPLQLRLLREENGGEPVRVIRNGMLIHVPRGRYQGVWRVFSIKNNATGVALDIASPDAISAASGEATAKINVSVKTLCKDGMVRRATDLTGEPG